MRKELDHPVVSESTDQIMHNIRDLMDSHGLRDWGLVAEDNLFELGRADLLDHIIYFSVQFMNVNTWDVWHDVAIHEIAHALNAGDPEADGYNGGHTKRWEELAHSLGAQHVVDIETREAAEEAGMKYPFTEREEKSDDMGFQFLMHRFDMMFGRESVKALRTYNHDDVDGMLIP